MGNITCKKCDVELMTLTRPNRYSCRIHNLDEHGNCKDCNNLYHNCRHIWIKKIFCINIY